MVQVEYKDGSEHIRTQEKTAKVLWERGQTKEFYQSLQDLIELLIVEHGHAWCMDVKEERGEISKMIAELLERVQR